MAGTLPPLPCPISPSFPVATAEPPGTPTRPQAEQPSEKEPAGFRALARENHPGELRDLRGLRRQARKLAALVLAVEGENGPCATPCRHDRCKMIVDAEAILETRSFSPKKLIDPVIP